jgi:hypothetical protein
MKITEAEVVWVPRHKAWFEGYVPPENAGSVRIERHKSGWRRMPGEVCMPAASDYGDHIEVTEERRLLSMFILFNTLVVRDNIDPKAAHTAFLQIDEYRSTISQDTPGAV